MKYEDLKKAIDEYTKKEDTDYAILINGKWGSGKTFFFRNEFCNDKSHI